MSLDAERVPARVEELLKGECSKGQIPQLWDGHAAERIVNVLESTRDVELE
jgi:UDP-N-acetylglucosamine 2-epimerase (non-hydrolysing)